ncbi:MAG TPA: hypothetical protein VKQ73_03335 [Stellaceae bacterium]|nr:hypothetical protein [Stellaceae bacterium]
MPISRIPRIALPVLALAAVAAAPLSAANAQPDYWASQWCTSSALSWPGCLASDILSTAGWILIPALAGPYPGYVDAENARAYPPPPPDIYPQYQGGPYYYRIR